MLLYDFSFLHSESCSHYEVKHPVQGEDQCSISRVCRPPIPVTSATRCVAFSRQIHSSRPWQGIVTSYPVVPESSQRVYRGSRLLNHSPGSEQDQRTLWTKCVKLRCEDRHASVAVSTRWRGQAYLGHMVSMPTAAHAYTSNLIEVYMRN